MPMTLSAPDTPIRSVTEHIHGVRIVDRYRWLEDKKSPETRRWLAAQTRYARAYLDGLTFRDRIQKRVRQLLVVDTYDSVMALGGRYFFRKRLAAQEQASIYMRQGATGRDELLIDPQLRKRGKYISVKPLRLSQDGKLLVYEVKDGGERTATIEIFDIERRKTLPDSLPRGFLRGFAFAADGKSFFYSHEAPDADSNSARVVRQHFIGTAFCDDQETIRAGTNGNSRIGLLSDKHRLGIMVYRFGEPLEFEFYLQTFVASDSPQLIHSGSGYSFAPRLTAGRILALTNRAAPNLCVVEVHAHPNQNSEWVDVVPANDCRITDWVVTEHQIFVAYICDGHTRIQVFGLDGTRAGEVVAGSGETVRLIGGSHNSDQVFIETESFTEPASISIYSTSSNQMRLWARRTVPFNSSAFGSRRIWYESKDGTSIPMFLLGRKDLFGRSPRPVVMTSYGGFGMSMTPQFSVLVTCLLERGCLLALPTIRGGSEFGVEWHDAAKRRKRQTAFDDFISAAEWLFHSGICAKAKLAIFGGSNSGLLVAAALTQRPELFAAVLCMVPVLDMLRYHLFDNSDLWRQEYGTADDFDDFKVLLSYSPYHRIRTDTAYPATMLVSGDADGTCNSLHARKMTARLQSANVSPSPVLLDYRKHRGHAPALPLSERIAGLTDRLAFLCDQLQLFDDGRSR